MQDLDNSQKNHMADSDSATTSSADEGDCLSNHPASPETRPAQDEMLAAEDEVSSTLPPQGVDPQGNSPTSHFSESPIKRNSLVSRGQDAAAGLSWTLRRQGPAVFSTHHKVNAMQGFKGVILCRTLLHHIHGWLISLGIAYTAPLSTASAVME